MPINSPPRPDFGFLTSVLLYDFDQKSVNFTGHVSGIYVMYILDLGGLYTTI